MNRSPRPALLSSVSSNLRGILFMVVFAATISTMHGVVRYMSAEVHPFEIAFFRNLTVFLLMIPLLLRSGRSAWRSARPGLQAVRGFIGAMAMLTWFYALSLVPLADATALSFTVVVFTTVCAIIVLRERVGIRRWSAIGIGVIGTLIILRPGLQAVSLGALVVLVSSVLWAASLICVKVLSRTDSNVTIVFYSALYFTPLSLIPALFVWQWPTLEQLAMLVLIGAMAAVSHLAIAQSLREAEASVVMPLDFTRLIWAAAFGYVVLGEFPDFWTWLGGTVIFASTVYISYREGRVIAAADARDALQTRPTL